MAELYRASNLCRRYGPVEAVRRCSFVIQEGDLICVTGPNGAGKSTLMEMLGFLIPPSQGELWFRGHRIPGAGKPVANRLAKLVTVMLQHPYLFHGSVRHNLDMALNARPADKSERHGRASRVLRQLDLEHLTDRPAKSLSVGERQRVALARAICLKTPVLLLDEPTANVDEEHLPAIEALIRRLRGEEGVTIVMATHDVSLADRVGADVWHICKGSLLPAPLRPGVCETDAQIRSLAGQPRD